MVMPKSLPVCLLKFGSNLLQFTPFSSCVFYLIFSFLRDVTRYQMLCLIFGIMLTQNESMVYSSVKHLGYLGV